MPGPWVTPGKYQLIERFKFFIDLASRRSMSPLNVLQRLARYRCARDEYRWPLEMRLMQWLRPQQRLS